MEKSESLLREIVNNYAHINKNLKELINMKEIKEVKEIEILIAQQEKLIKIISKNL